MCTCIVSSFPRNPIAWLRSFLRNEATANFPDCRNKRLSIAYSVFREKAEKPSKRRNHLSAMRFSLPFTFEKVFYSNSDFFHPFQTRIRLHDTPHSRRGSRRSHWRFTDGRYRLCVLLSLPLSFQQYLPSNDP